MIHQIRKTILILGFGKLSFYLSNALLSHCCELDIHILSRQKPNTWQLKILKAQARLNNSINLRYKQIDWEQQAFIEDTIIAIKPDLVFNTASYQSVWSLQNKDKWSELLVKFGYALSIGHQTAISFKLNSIFNWLADNNTMIVNCCYPDLTNHILNKSGVTVHYGIGNIGILDQVLKATHNDSDHELFGTHAHLTEMFKKPIDRRIHMNLDNPGVLNKVNNLLLENDEKINFFTALNGVSLLNAVINKKSVETHLPGMDGVIGGYFYKFENGAIDRSNYDENTEKLSIKSFEIENVIIEKDSYWRFSEELTDALKKYSPGFDLQFKPEEFEDYHNNLINLSKLIKNG